MAYKSSLTPEQQAQIALEDSTPDDQLTPEQVERKRVRLAKRKERGKQKLKKAGAASETRAVYWERSRKLLSQTELAGLLAQQELVLDQLWWIDYGHLVPPDDLDFFVSLEEGVDDLVAFVKEHDVVHLGAITKNDLPADWITQPFWQDSELMTKILGEGEPTANYAKLGFLTALPDWRVIEFLTKKTGAAWSWQKAADFVGYRIAGNTCCYGRGKTLYEAWGHAKEVKTPPAKLVTTIHIPEQAGSYQPPAPSIKDKDDA